MANSFTPPTYRETFDGERKDRWSLMRWYSFPVGYSVLITSSTATTYPGKVGPTQDEIDAADAGSGDAGKAFFTNGVTYTVTDAEKTALEAAGYTVTTT